MEYREHATMNDAIQTGASKRSAMQVPNTNTESAMPASTGGNGTPNIPSTAPPTIIAGKNDRQRLKQWRPRNAPHSPTLIIASR